MVVATERAMVLPLLCAWCERRDAKLCAADEMRQYLCACTSKCASVCILVLVNPTYLGVGVAYLCISWPPLLVLLRDIRASCSRVRAHCLPKRKRPAGAPHSRHLVLHTCQTPSMCIRVSWHTRRMCMRVR